MAIDTRFRHDIKVNFSEEPQNVTTGRANLALSSGGDLSLVSGKDKLMLQILRRLVSNDTEIPLNTASAERELKTLFLLELQSFIDSQVADTNSFDPTFSGYHIYKRTRPSGFNRDTQAKYLRISQGAVTHKYVDTDVSNGYVYEYGIARVFTNGVELPITEKISATPTAYTTKQAVVIGNSVTAFQNDKSVTLYVNTNRLYKKSELLNEILSVDARESPTDPRKFIVDIQVRSLLSELLTFSESKQSAI